MMRAARHGITAFMALAFLAPATTEAADAQQRPQRIVSMTLCTDELLMRIVDPFRIASITGCQPSLKSGSRSSWR